MSRDEGQEAGGGGAEELLLRPRRRRWPWVVLAAAILVFAGPTAWRYRPLSEGERQIVGVWQVVGEDQDPEMAIVTFTRGRRFESRVVARPPREPFRPGSQFKASGSWGYLDGQLTIRGGPEAPWDWQTLIENLRRTLLGEGEQHEYTVDFLEAGRLLLKGPDNSNDNNVLERIP